MRTMVRQLGRVVLTLVLASTLSGCATTSVPLPEVPARHTVSEFRDQRIAYVPDPWERFNRSMYKFNFNFDKYVYLPVVSGYEFVTPIFVQARVSNFFNNLGELRNLGNSLLQFKGKESLTTLGRFVTNSTVGIGGLFDPATHFGLDRHNEDFGLTLGNWGVKSGPYLVLPIFGPSSARDAGGLAVDSGASYAVYSLVDPFGNVDDGTAISLGIGALGAIDARHQQTFRYYESSFPFEYYMVRFFYHEKRELEVNKK